MSFKSIFITVFILFTQNTCFGADLIGQKCYLLNADHKIVDSISLSVSEINDLQQNKHRPNPLLSLFKAKQRKNKKITAALLAFPFPFGIVGLHRIYLGTAPYVPVAYIASLGGIFGVLPFIDFCVLLLDKDEKRYIENKKVFMWVN